MDSRDKERFAVAVGAMLETFGVEATKPILHGYWLGLLELTIDQLEFAVGNAIRCRRTVPKPADLLELAGVVVDPDAMASRAFTAASDAVSCFGPYKTVDFEDRAINATLRALGGWPSFCSRFTDAESEKWLRIEFIRAYKGYASRDVGDESGLPLQGISETSNNKPQEPRRVACKWAREQQVSLPNPLSIDRQQARIS